MYTYSYIYIYTCVHTFEVAIYNFPEPLIDVCAPPDGLCDIVLVSVLLSFILLLLVLLQVITK